MFTVLLLVGYDPTLVLGNTERVMETIFNALTDLVN